jgi:hypothetical protein
VIDPHWQVIDLDPVTWRRIGAFFEPSRYIAAAQPDEHGLFVLHDDGLVLNAVDTATHSRPNGIPTQISDPHALAQELYERGEWQRVHIINRKHLAWVAQQSQATPQRELTLDGYYHMVYSLLWDREDGYVAVPAHPGNFSGWTYADIRRFTKGISGPATIALGVYADAALSIGLILVVEGGMIRRVTTFEALKWDVPQPGPTQQTLTALCTALEVQFAPPVVVLLCTEAVFEGWLSADDKAAYLVEARANATAIWHR